MSRDTVIGVSLPISIFMRAVTSVNHDTIEGKRWCRGRFS
jgi:hypothetical protein